MRNYELEEFLMHYGVGRSGGGKTGTNRPKGLKYKTRGSTSLYEKRQAQMLDRDGSTVRTERDRAVASDTRNRAANNYRKNYYSKRDRSKAESDAAANKIKNSIDNVWAKQKEKVKTASQIEKYRLDKAVDNFNNSLVAKLQRKAKENRKTKDQIEKYRREKAEDEKVSQWKQAEKRNKEKVQKFLDIRANQEKQIDTAKKQKRVKEQQSRNEFNKSVLNLIDKNRSERKGGKLQNPNKRVIESTLPKFPDVTVKRKKKKKKTSGESRRSWQD